MHTPALTRRALVQTAFSTSALLVLTAVAAPAAGAAALEGTGTVAATEGTLATAAESASAAQQAASFVAAPAGSITVTGGQEAASALVSVPAGRVVPDKISVIAAPHLDDEWQVSSQTANSPDNYQIYVSFTRGEQTQYCLPTAPIAPGYPQPEGQFTESCGDLRIDSWVRYISAMSTEDIGTPGDFAYLGQFSGFPTNGVDVFRDDAGTRVVDLSIRVWRDRQGRGALVNFNLGDGDLTRVEVDWALRTVLANRATLGLNSTLPVHNILGSFSNSGYGGCKVYAHPDHRAVHEALWNGDFGAAYNAGATCATDPDAVRTQNVPDDYATAAFGESGGQGWFDRFYGWLGKYRLDQKQGDVFMKEQSFWRRIFRR